MSLLPLLLELDRSRRLQDQHFALALTPDDFLSFNNSPSPSQLLFKNYYRPWQRLDLKDVGSTIKVNKEKFQINLDVQHFGPEEISVKAVDGFVVVEGKHEEKEDEHGFVTRHFVRRYALPKECSVDSVESKLSSDGVLSIVAPLNKEAIEGARTVPIVQTGPVKTQPGDRGECPVTNGQ